MSRSKKNLKQYNLISKGTGKEESARLKISRKKKIVKIRAKINETETLNRVRGELMKLRAVFLE